MTTTAMLIDYRRDDYRYSDRGREDSRDRRGRNNAREIKCRDAVYKQGLAKMKSAK